MKQKFIKSTSILLIGGILTKLLGMIIKMIMNRNIGIEGITLYSLILPTFSLAITIGQIGLPITLSRLVAINNKKNKDLYYTIIPILLLWNIILMFIILKTSNFIGLNLLKNENTIIFIKAIALVIPFTTLSSILRSYFFGKEKMIPHTLSNIIENIIRLLLVLLITNLKINIKQKVLYIILSNILSEGISVLVLLLYLPKKININNLKFEKLYIKETFKESIPNITSNLIGSISYFIEPILITTLLTKYIDISLIITEYGIINGYVIPLLMIPSFFSIAISQAILPTISRLYKDNDYMKIKKILIKVIIIILLFSNIPILLLEFKGDKILYLLYKNTLGFNYLKIISPIFIIHYIEHPLSFTLYSLGKTKDLLKLSIITLISKILFIFILSNIFKGITPYIITMIINMIVTCIYLIKKINYYL